MKPPTLNIFKAPELQESIQTSVKIIRYTKHIQNIWKAEDERS